MAREHDQVLHDFVVARSDGLRRTAFLMCGDWQVAQDLVHEIMSDLVLDQRRRQAADLESYARRAVMDAFHDDWWRRFRRRDRFYVASGDEPLGVPDPTLKVSVLAALSELPVRSRAVMVLRHWEDLSVRETADTLGVRARAVQTHDARGVEALHESLADHPDLDDLSAQLSGTHQPDAEWFATDPDATGPDDDYPDQADPEITDPVVIDPEITDPEITVPVVIDPVTLERQTADADDTDLGRADSRRTGRVDR